MAEITVFYEGPLVTRSEALAAGLKRYFTGRPCKRGHIALRSMDKVCVVCRRQRQRSDRAKEASRAYDLAHREQARARQAAYRSSEKGKEARRRYGLEYRLSGRQSARDKIRTVSRTAAQKADRNQWSREYRQTPRGKQARLRDQSRRRALKAGSSGTFAEQDHQKLLMNQKKCHICGKRFTKSDPATLDHVIPLAEGGVHDPSNIALAHRGCNLKKNARRTHLI